MYIDNLKSDEISPYLTLMQKTHHQNIYLKIIFDLINSKINYLIGKISLKYFKQSIFKKYNQTIII